MIMHMIYPGMINSVQVAVGSPVIEPGYDGFVWVRITGDPMAEWTKVHESRLSADPVGQFSNS